MRTETLRAKWFSDARYDLASALWILRKSEIVHSGTFVRDQCFSLRSIASIIFLNVLSSSCTTFLISSVRDCRGLFAERGLFLGAALRRSGIIARQNRQTGRPSDQRVDSSQGTCLAAFRLITRRWSAHGPPQDNEEPDQKRLATPREFR